MYIIITILILLIARLAYFYIWWKRSVVVSGKDYSLQYSDEGLSDLQALLFRVYTRNICEKYL